MNLNDNLFAGVLISCFLWSLLVTLHKQFLPKRVLGAASWSSNCFNSQRKDYA